MRGILFSCLHRAVCGWSKFASAGRVGFVVLFFLCVLTIAVVFNACDSRGGMPSAARESVAGDNGRGGAPPPDSNGVTPRQAAVVSLDEALAAVDEYSYGGSVGDPQKSNESQGLAESLISALRGALAKTGVERFTADVPNGDSGRIRDIAYDMDTLALTWTYSNDGDYDLNGSVGVPDITSIANNYLGEVTYSEEQYSDGRFIPDGDPATPEGAANWYLAFIDTDTSGDIGIADITAIANNYLNDVAGYAVFANDDPNAPIDEWIEITRLTLDSAKDALPEGFTFPIEFTATISEDDGLFAMVRPFDSTGAFGDASEIVPLSTSVAPKIYAVTPNEGIEGRVIQFLVVSTGVAPMTYRWSIGGAFPSSSTDKNPTVVLSTPGQYTCSVTAENDFGTDYFQFSLTVDEVPLPEEQTAFAVAGAVPQYSDAPLITQLTCNTSYSTAGKIVYYQWDFESDGINDVYQTEPYHVTHEYPAGEYTATLTVMDEAGSKDTAKMYVVALSPETQWEVVREVADSGRFVSNSISIFVNPSTGLPAMAYVKDDLTHCYMYEEYPGKWSTDTFTPATKPQGSQFAPPILLPDGAIIYAAMYAFAFGTPHIAYVKRNPDGTWDEPFYAEMSIGTGNANLHAAVRPDGQPALLYNVGSTSDVIRYSWWDEDQWRREDTGIRGELSGADFEYIDGNPAFTRSDPNLFYYEKTAEGWQPTLVATLPEGVIYSSIVESDGILRILAHFYGFAAYERAEDGHWTASRYFDDWLDSSRGRAASDGSGYLAVYEWYDEPLFDHIRYAYRKISPDGEDALTESWQSGIILPGDDLMVAADPLIGPGGVAYVVVTADDGKAITLLSHKFN